MAIFNSYVKLPGGKYPILQKVPIMWRYPTQPWFLFNITGKGLAEKFSLSIPIPDLKSHIWYGKRWILNENIMFVYL